MVGVQLVGHVRDVWFLGVEERVVQHGLLLQQSFFETRLTVHTGRLLAD